jgi:tripartite-type tricarboxylate transporter receptor subunit TctC
MSRKFNARFVGVALATLVTLVATVTPSAAAEQLFPDRPIKLVVPFAPGGAADQLARIVAEGMTSRLGQPVVVENKGGANGIIATGAVASSKPDGHTLLLCTSALLTNQSLYKTPYDVSKNITPITKLVSVPLLLVTNPALNLKTVSDIINYGKATPGGLSYSSWGIGSSAHLAGELLRLTSGVPMVHVPFKGSAAAMSEVLAGRIPFAFTTIPVSLQHIAAGKLTLVASTSVEPLPQLPNAPLLKNVGYPELTVEGWNGICGPGGMKASTTAAISNAILETLAGQSARRSMIDDGYVIVANTPLEFAKDFKREMPMWNSIIKRSGVTAE